MVNVFQVRVLTFRYSLRILWKQALSTQYVNHSSNHQITGVNFIISHIGAKISTIKVKDRPMRKSDSTLQTKYTNRVGSNSKVLAKVPCSFFVG